MPAGFMRKQVPPPLHFVVKLFPEIIIKSPPVRKRLTVQLRDNLSILLKRLNIGIEVQRDWEKLEIFCPELETGQQAAVVDILSSTPGVANFAEVHRYPLVDLDDILHRVLAHWGDSLAGKTFCVRVKRSGNHPFRSTDVERHLGAGLLRQTAARSVKLQDPDLCLRLEIRQQQLFLIEQVRPGLGGFPLGSQDSVLSLISGGFDSSVASYQMIRRGLRTHYCFFNLGGRAHELGVREMATYLWKRFGASHRVKFVSVPFAGVVSEILQKVGNPYMGVVLKRMMLRAADRIADELGAGALVTGESIGQVASQTLPNLQAIDSASELLTLRPLVAMDKDDIIRVARKIGTESMAANVPEYCGVISVNPTTRARSDRLALEEQNFDFAVLEQAVAARSISFIDTALEKRDEPLAVETFHAPQPGHIIIDIRHPDEIENHPVASGNLQTVAIPFFELNQRFAQLDQRQSYLLYCDKGVMSRLHAELLREAGFRNVAVYRP